MKAWDGWAISRSWLTIHSIKFIPVKEFNQKERSIMKAILTNKDGEQEVVEFDPTRTTVEDIIFDYLRRNVDYHNEDIELVDMWADWQNYVSVAVEE
jgi:hypothetical protein